MTPTAVTPRPEVKIGASYLDVVFPEGLVVTGNKLVALHKQFKDAGFQASIGTGETTEPAELTLRLHGASPDDVTKLEALDLFAAFDFDPSYDPGEKLKVLFVYQGIAYITPNQPLAVGSLLNAGRRLAATFGSKVCVSLYEEFLVVSVNQIRFECFDDPSADLKLAAQISPKYAHAAALQCGSDRKGAILKGGRYFVARVLNGKDFEPDLAALNGAPGILSTPAPEVKPNGSQPLIYVWTSLALDTSTATLYQCAAETFLRLGIYPFGEFNVFDSERERRTYNPPALLADGVTNSRY